MSWIHSAEHRQGFGSDASEIGFFLSFAIGDQEGAHFGEAVRTVGYDPANYFGTMFHVEESFADFGDGKKLWKFGEGDADDIGDFFHIDGVVEEVGMFDLEVLAPLLFADLRGDEENFAEDEANSTRCLASLEF